MTQQINWYAVNTKTPISYIQSNKANIVRRRKPPINTIHGCLFKSPIMVHVPFKNKAFIFAQYHRNYECNIDTHTFQELGTSEKTKYFFVNAGFLLSHDEKYIIIAGYSEICVFDVETKAIYRSLFECPKLGEYKRMFTNIDFETKTLLANGYLRIN